jgi:hypothetical protein
MEETGPEVDTSEPEVDKREALGWKSRSRMLTREPVDNESEGPDWKSRSRRLTRGSRRLTRRRREGRNA